MTSSVANKNIRLKLNFDNDEDSASDKNTMIRDAATVESLQELDLNKSNVVNNCTRTANEETTKKASELGPSSSYNKHVCEKCRKSFKNVLLLSRHICEKNVVKKAVKRNDLNSTALNQNKYHCEKCQKSFKNVALQERHQCQNGNKPSGSLNITLGNGPVGPKFEKLKVRTTIGTPSMLQNSVVGLKGKENKRRRLSITPGKGSPTVKVSKKFSCKACSLKFSTQLLLDIHTKRNCVKPVKKVLIPDSPIPGLHKMLSPSVKVKDIINNQIEKSGSAVSVGDKILTKPVQTGARRYKDFGGIPAPPRLRAAFQGLIMQLQSSSAVNELKADSKEPSN